MSDCHLESYLSHYQRTPTDMELSGVSPFAPHDYSIFTREDLLKMINEFRDFSSTIDIDTAWRIMNNESNKKTV